MWCARRGRGVKGRVRLVYKVGEEKWFIRNSIPYWMRTQGTDTAVEVIGGGEGGKAVGDWRRRIIFTDKDLN
jgi:hypothetical protein